MSCCGENGGSGSGREGSSGCGGCKTYPDLVEKTTTETVVLGVGPAEKARFFDGAEVAAAAAENGCKCGSNCTCDPCTCK